MLGSTPFIILLLIAVAVFYLKRRKPDAQAPGWKPPWRWPGGGGIGALKREIHDLFGPMDDAEGILRRTLAALKRQHPDKPERWYYEKALEDLRRDRRR